MSNVISNVNAGQISFPDCILSGFKVTPQGVRFCSDGIHIEGHGLICGRCDVVCNAFSGVGVRRFVDGDWREMIAKESGVLREICEWSCDDRDLRFAGFESESGMWQEYLLHNFDIKVSVDADSPPSTPRG